jgi:acetylornithine/N-succinyldiaminopimelate aminotransferase
MEEMRKPEFLEHVRLMANHLGQALEGLKDRHPNSVEALRGRGLLRGVKLKFDPKKVQEIARAEKLLVGTASDNVIRLAPPLIIEPEHLGEAIAILDKALTQAEQAA